MTPEASNPTVFHITHYKAGSRWIHAILNACVRDKLVVPRDDRGQFLEDPIRPGCVYSAVYATREEFDRVGPPSPWRRFVVIRDLRDTLVSGYWSVKVSHARFEERSVAEFRERLQGADVEEGLLLALDQWLPVNAAIQRSWLDAGEPVIRYEDLLAHDVEILERVLIDECEYPIRRPLLRRAVENMRFERLSGGRSRGEEDVTAHRRKGIAGDWRNYFTEPVKDAFKERWGELLIATGYEGDLNW